MNILVIGANGQLGNEMRIVTKRSEHNYIFADVAEHPCEPTVRLDITDRDAVLAFVREKGIQVIVNCAAYTNVDKAENDRDTAELLNATAVRYLAESMKVDEGMLIHISTDYVFGAEPYNTPCHEEQKGAPTSVYGLTKLHGEQAIFETGCKYIIIRTGWLYSEFGNNFLKTMLNLTATKPQLKVVFDQVGTPTYALDLAEAIVEIIRICSPDVSGKHENETDKYGVYHYSNEGVCSWYDFAKMIAKYSGHTECDIQPCHSSEFPSSVNRPAYSVLDKTKIKQTFGIKVPYWADSLKECLKNME